MSRPHSVVATDPRWPSPSNRCYAKRLRPMAVLRWLPLSPEVGTSAVQTHLRCIPISSSRASSLGPVTLRRRHHDVATTTIGGTWWVSGRAWWSSRGFNTHHPLWAFDFEIAFFFVILRKKQSYFLNIIPLVYYVCTNCVCKYVHQVHLLTYWISHTTTRDQERVAIIELRKAKH